MIKYLSPYKLILLIMCFIFLISQNLVKNELKNREKIKLKLHQLHDATSALKFLFFFLYRLKF